MHKTFMPIYLACDLADGSGGYSTMLEALSDAYSSDPFAASHAPVHLVGFSPQARLFGSLNRDSTESLTFPVVDQSATTGYGALFKLMAKLVEDEIRQAKVSGDLIHRALLIVIAKAPPSADDEFWSSYQTLMSTKWHPGVVAISLSQDTAATAARLASITTFAASGIEPIAELINEVIHDLVSSRTGNDISVRIPGYIEGLTRLELPSSWGRG